jgi:predicted ATPase/transcriptional regulator with XRE-family HTH domain/TolA-binding protein
METVQQEVSFRELLRHYRRARGWTQEELAERAQLSRLAIQALEAGRRQTPRSDTVRLLADALELDEAEQTQFAEISRAARRHEYSSAQSAPLAELPPAPLLVPPTGLIGRAKDLMRASALLRGENVRLLTLTGPAGVGKTRLGLAVAEALRDFYLDGVVTVPLAPLRDPKLVPAALLQTLEVREGGERHQEEILLDWLRDRRLLLLIDNVEHLVTAVAPLLVRMLAASSQLTLLLTSRVRLRVRGERIFYVAPLAVSDALISLTSSRAPAPDDLHGSPAVELFIERARAVVPDLELTPENLAAIAEICRKLDGLPLAIELAAARVSLLPPPALLARMKRRLPLLISGDRDLPARQRTLRDALAGSDDLLSPAERSLFRRLSIFVGGAALDAVVAMCAQGHEEAQDEAGDDREPEAIERLQALVEHSLLQRVDSAECTTPRVTMLETVREYAWEQLLASGEHDAVARKHATYYLALAERAAPQLIGPEVGTWLKCLDEERGNLRAALAWSLEQDELEIGFQLAAALWRFWYTRGYISEGREWLERFLALIADRDASEAGNSLPRLAPYHIEVLQGAGKGARLQGDRARARALHEASLALARAHGDPVRIASVLNELAITVGLSGDAARAEALFAEGLAMAQEQGDILRSAKISGNMGVLASHQGDLKRAAAFYEESLAVFRALDDSWDIALALYNLGESLMIQGDYAQARERYEESLAISQELRDKDLTAVCLYGLGDIAQDEGRNEEAMALYEESLRLFRAADNMGDQSMVLDHMSAVAQRLGDVARAQALGEESLALARAMRNQRMIAYTLATVGHRALERGDLAAAASFYRESLLLYRKLDTTHDLAACLEGLAAILLAVGQPDRGVRLCGAAAALREVRGTPLPPIARANQQRLLDEARTAIVGAQTFDALWSSGKDLTLEQALDEAIASSESALSSIIA